MTVFCLGACIQRREFDSSKEKLKPCAIMQAIIGEISKKTDPVTIDSIELKGNLLEIAVTYTGGCKIHEFKLIGAAAISKSLPPRRAIQLVHLANDDTCQFVQTKNLRFNIEAFAYSKESGSKIFLDLSGYENTIEYILN
jgi:hypothetical protein